MTTTERITAAVMETGAPALALEEGIELAQHWVDNDPIAGRTIAAVETGFVLWLDDNTVVIGVQDCLTEEDGQTVLNEWKTTKEATRYWNAHKWQESITEGPQIAIYGLAAREGKFYPREGGVFEPKVRHPRVRVRAISKSKPPVIWPEDNEGVIDIPDDRLEMTRKALLAKAAGLRAMRQTSAPWALPGIWCTNQFRRQCPFYFECVDRKIPEGFGPFAKGDPAYSLALPHIGRDPSDPNLVIMGYSMFSSLSECAEKYRRNTLIEEKETSHDLSVGTVLHAGVASWYTIRRENEALLDKTRPDSE